jgi:drug/metabolite transporter (DMT)-like permease
MERIPASSAARARQLTGLAAITGAVLLLSLSDSLVKLASERLALGQLLLVRSLVAAALILGAAALRAELRRLRGAAGRWVWARSLCLTGMWACYYAALPAMPFALAAACYYTAPMWMAVLSRLLLGQPVRPRQALAIGLGLAGVLLALQPGVQTVTPLMLLPLAAGFLYALAAVITGSRCTAESPLSLGLNLNLALALGGLGAVAGLAAFGPGGEAGFLLAAWRPLAAADWALLAGLGLLLALIAVAVALAYQRAPAPVVGLFDNAYLVFAALWGAVLFGERPQPAEGAGMALIACGALLASAPPGRVRGPRRRRAAARRRPR